MREVKIMGIATANPSSKWTQKEILKSVHLNEQISNKAKTFYKRFLSDQGIRTRHFGMQTLEHVNTESPDQANQRFSEIATEIGTEAIRKCLDQYQVSADEIDALIVTTCTGYLCPGLTSYLSQAIGFKDSIEAIDLAGTGCGAAIPALRSAYQYLQTHADSNALVVSVEVCSAALSWGDEIDLILSNALFSDGAAACLLSNKPENRGHKILNFESLLWPEYREELRFKTRDSRLCNVIDRSVPGIAAKAVKFLDGKITAGLTEMPKYYGVHPGGRRILDAFEESLDFKNQSLQRSRDVLFEYGNMSSPSILYVLKEISEKDQPEKNENIALFAFGAGFSAFAVLLESDGSLGGLK